MMHLPGKLIFIKPKKVGGTTMELLLSSACGPDAAFTPLGVGEDRERCRLGYQLPSNVFMAAEDEQGYHDAIGRLCAWNAPAAPADEERPEAFPDWHRAVELRRRTRIRNHANLMQVRNFVGPQAFRSTPLVSICRHPFELAVSQAFWNLREGSGGSLEEALDSIVSQPHVNIRRYGLHRQWRGKATPYALILRLEELSQELALLEELAGVALPRRIPHAKGKVRGDRRPAALILSHRQKRQMERYNRPLFELWENPPRP